MLFYSLVQAEVSAVFTWEWMPRCKILFGVHSSGAWKCHRVPAGRPAGYRHRVFWQGFNGAGFWGQHQVLAAKLQGQHVVSWIPPVFFDILQIHFAAILIDPAEQSAKQFSFCSTYPFYEWAIILPTWSWTIFHWTTLWKMYFLKIRSKYSTSLITKTGYQVRSWFNSPYHP